MSPIAFDHCVIKVSNWERSNAFYGDVVGAQIVEQPGGGYAYRFGSAQLNCHGPGLDPTPLAAIPVAPGNSDLCFTYPGTVEEATAHLAAQGVEIEVGPVDRRGVQGAGKSVYFRDPDGSLLELISYSS